MGEADPQPGFKFKLKMESTALLSTDGKLWKGSGQNSHLVYVMWALRRPLNVGWRIDCSRGQGQKQREASQGLAAIIQAVQTGFRPRWKVVRFAYV